MDPTVMQAIERMWAERAKAQGIIPRGEKPTHKLLTAQADFFAGAMAMHVAMRQAQDPTNTDHGQSMPPGWVFSVMSSRLIVPLGKIKAAL